MSGWQVLLLCWVCYLAGYARAALMVMARSDSDEVEQYRAGLNDD